MNKAMKLLEFAKELVAVTAQLERLGKKVEWTDAEDELAMKLEKRHRELCGVIETLAVGGAR